MPERITRPELPIGLPEVNEEAFFAFEAVVGVLDRQSEELSVEHIWDVTTQASPQIEHVLKGVLATCKEGLLFDNSLEIMKHTDVSMRGFMAGVALVMHSEYHHCADDMSFQDFILSPWGRAVLPVQDELELARTKSAMYGGILRETNMMDEDDEGLDTFSEARQSARDSETWLETNSGLRGLVFAYYDVHAVAFLEPAGNATHYHDEIRLRESYYYGFEQAVEMFIQSYETRALERLDFDSEIEI